MWISVRMIYAAWITIHRICEWYIMCRRRSRCCIRYSALLHMKKQWITINCGWYQKNSYVSPFLCPYAVFYMTTHNGQVFDNRNSKESNRYSQIELCVLDAGRWLVLKCYTCEKHIEKPPIINIHVTWIWTMYIVQFYIHKQAVNIQNSYLSLWWKSSAEN